MESLRIDIVNPKAKRILKELEALELINIRRHESSKPFQVLLNKLRKKPMTLTQEEIIKEVEAVRTKRNVKKS